MAIVLDETEADACIAVLEMEDNILISAGTIAEALIVGARRNVSEEIASLIDGLGFNAVAVTPASARRIIHAYGRWGKSIDAAGLNFGDCLPMKSPERTTVPCCMAAVISPGPTSRAFCEFAAADRGCGTPFRQHRCLVSAADWMMIRVVAPLDRQQGDSRRHSGLAWASPIANNATDQVLGRQG